MSLRLRYRNGVPTPQVIIWITCRNYENYLPECLMSAHSQTVPCAVYVAHDDCGGNNPIGLSASRNRILKTNFWHMSFDYVVFLDADDTISPDYVAKMLSVAEYTPYALVASSAVLFGDQSGIVTPPSKITLAQELEGNMINCSALIPLPVLHRLQGYNEALYAWEDWELYCRALHHGHEIMACPEARLNYRRHPGSMNREYAGTLGTMKQYLQRKYGQVV